MFVLLIIIIVVLIINTVYKIKSENVVSRLKFTKFFLCSMRFTKNFTENDVELNMKRFLYTNSLYRIQSEDKDKTWKNDPDIFIRMCLISINILSYFVDNTSIYYKDENIWRMLKFVCRMFYIKMKENNVDFYECDPVYNIFTSFLISMYNCRDIMACKHNKCCDCILDENFYKYLKFYKTRFNCEFSLKVNNKEISAKYDKYSEMSKQFIKNY